MPFMHDYSDLGSKMKHQNVPFSMQEAYLSEWDPQTFFRYDRLV